MITVTCKHCQWTGRENELKKIEAIEHCPSCNQTDGLLDNELEPFREAILADVFGFDFDE